MALQAFNARTQETEEEWSLWVCEFEGQPGLPSKFQDSQSYTQRNPVSRNNKQKEKYKEIKFHLFQHLHNYHFYNLLLSICIFLFILTSFI